jgi:hypothetical protein
MLQSPALLRIELRPEGTCAMKLPPDATINDVLSTLTKPVEYLSRVYARMNAAQKAHEGVVVRIGVRGTGQIPNYRIDHAGESGQSMTAFDGQTHKPFTDVRSVDTEIGASGA